MDFLNMVYDQVYYVGIQTLRYGKRFFRWLLSLLLKPVKAVGTLIFTLFILLNKYGLKTFHKSREDFKKLIEDARKVSLKRSINSDGNKKIDIKSFMGYVSVAFKRYKSAFVYVLNYAVPVLSLILLINVISFWSDTSFALEVKYNNEVIGYVSSESVYKEARQLAYDRLDVKSNTVTLSENSAAERAVIDGAEYKIKPIKRSQMNSAVEICDKLIEKSNIKITNACGIYIDDEFICAVKNETDALSVFDAILAQHETDDTQAVVSFVEDIDYVQGLYPDNEYTIKDAAYLQELLNSTKRAAKYYTVQEGDTILEIVEKFETDMVTLITLNPELKETLYVGQTITIQNEVDYIQVQTTKTEYREKEVPYETIKINTGSLYVGDTKVVSKGQNGIEKITELVTYVGGVKVSSKEVSRETVKEAVAEKIQVGTKKNPAVSGNVVSYGGRFVWPAIGAYSISSDYGYRNFGDGWHGGIDIVRGAGKSTGCVVVAAEAGTVVFAGWKNAAGYTVIIDHGNGLRTNYYHMQKGSIMVSSGQKVARGQSIGKIGATGYVTGAHLHFEVTVNGKDVNPRPYLGI